MVFSKSCQKEALIFLSKIYFKNIFETSQISLICCVCQVTVRFHTKQRLSVYDRFGRLIHGSEILAKDVLEYVVFEKHLSNMYGAWRVHDKIIPDWAPPKEPSKLTRIRESKSPVDTAVVEKEEPKDAPAITDK